MAKKKTPASTFPTKLFVIQHVEDDSVWYEAYPIDRLDGIGDGEVVAEYRVTGDQRFKKTTAHDLDPVR